MEQETEREELGAVRDRRGWPRGVHIAEVRESRALWDSIAGRGREIYGQDLKITYLVCTLNRIAVVLYTSVNEFIQEYMSCLILLNQA